MSNPRKVIIIGSGPAGFTAAIYAARANLEPLLFEGLTRGGIPGGQLMITNDVENYPGFPEKIAGPELMKAFREQALRQGAEVITEDVNKVDFSTTPFQVWAGTITFSTRRGRSSLPRGRRRSGSGSRASTRSRGAACRPARCVTGRSSVGRMCWSSEAAIPRWRSRCTSRGSAAP
jgi:hypothetical protein